MKKRKMTYAFVAVALVAILSIASVNATLDIRVEVASPYVNPGDSQVITATTNEPGIGLLLVAQPAMEDVIGFTDLLASNPELAAFVTALPPEILAQLYSLLNRIVSYALIGPIPEDPFLVLPELSIPFTFPDDFCGVNGEPSTFVPGDYIIMFIFISNYEALPPGTTVLDPNVLLIELDFSCGSWFVMPEYALGTVAPIIASLAALPLAKQYYKRKHA